MEPRGAAFPVPPHAALGFPAGQGRPCSHAPAFWAPACWAAQSPACGMLLPGVRAVPGGEGGRLGLSPQKGGRGRGGQCAVCGSCALSARGRGGRSLGESRFGKGVSFRQVDGDIGRAGQRMTSHRPAASCSRMIACDSRTCLARTQADGLAD